MSSPRAIVIARDEWITDDLVAAFTAILCQCTDPIGLHGTRRVCVRSNDRSAIHSIIACHRDNAVVSNRWLIAANLFTFRCQVTPKARLETCSLCIAIKSMRVGAWVDSRRADVCGIVEILDCSEGDRCQWFAVNDCVWKQEIRNKMLALSWTETNRLEHERRLNYIISLFFFWPTNNKKTHIYKTVPHYPIRQFQDISKHLRRRAHDQGRNDMWSSSEHCNHSQPHSSLVVHAASHT